MANLRQESIRQGLCRDCGGPRGEGGTDTRCAKDAAEHSRRQAERNDLKREEWRSEGLCLRCGGVRAGSQNGDATPTLCGDCAYLQREASRRYYQGLQPAA